MTANVVIKACHIFEILKREVGDVVGAPVSLQGLEVVYNVVGNGAVWTNHRHYVRRDSRNHKAIFTLTVRWVKVEWARWVESGIVRSENLRGPMVCVIKESSDLSVCSYNIDCSTRNTQLVKGLSKKLQEACVANRRCNSSSHIHDDEHEETRA